MYYMRSIEETLLRMVRLPEWRTRAEGSICLVLRMRYQTV